jgi:P4 family phage/plasmid primase-like protien
MDINDPIIDALEPLVRRVRTDVTAVKHANGAQAWTRQPLTRERLARHTNSGPARGVSPIKAGQNVTMVALLDFDSHGGEVGWTRMSEVVHLVCEMMELVYAWTPIVFRSSGGRGVHLYVIWEQPQDARSVRIVLREILEACDLKPGVKGVHGGTVEVFPKQNAVPDGGYGNQFILPLAGKSELLQYGELSGLLEVVPREELSAAMWCPSPPVPLKGEDDTGGSRETTPPPEHDNSLWRLALDAIPNDAKRSLDYDAWRNIIFAIHHETKGSDDGLALAMEFSRRSPKYDEAFLLNRVWPYVRSERGGAVTGRSIMSIASRYGWHEPLDDTAFEVIPSEDDDEPDLVGLEPDRTARDGSTVQGEPGSAAPAPPAIAQPPAPARGTIPEAKHLTTDQANANRLVRQYGKRVLVVAGKWHTFNSKCWATDESDVYRYACKLSEMVGEEAIELDRKAKRLTDEALTRAAALAAQQPGTDPDNISDDDLFEINETQGAAERLSKWTSRCEMRPTIEAAVGLAKKMLAVDPSYMDRDLMLLNVANGTLDLRTGELRKHKPGDYITKISEIHYDEAADTSAWETTVAEICGEDAIEPEQRTLTRFMQRWFGYCATGSVREQVFVVHWGTGRNGKSTILETIRRVLGEYAGVAASGLVASDGKGFDRHPTEVAALFGKRMVTAHETDENMLLREGLIKSLTGGDRVQARYMREDFFEFDPTHKIQLLTNHKPQIRGQDPGIWRRVLLVPYVQSFGTQAQLDRGEVKRLADLALAEAIGTPAGLRGVLRWVVQGAAEWHAGGLRPPSLVIDASAAYQYEQDRVAQFVREACEVAPPGADLEGWWEPLTHGMGGVYPAYQGWCKDGGFHPLSRQRLIESLRSAVPGLVVQEAKAGKGEARRKVMKLMGLRLLETE